MNKRWICSDVWMDILPSFDHAQLGLNLALLSDRFDVLVDAHFNGKSELIIWREIIIRKDKGPKAKMSVWVDGKWVAFPMPDRPLPNKIRFKDLQIEYIDHSVIEFLRSNKKIWERNGTNLDLYIEAKDDQPIWDVFASEIWPFFAPDIRQLYFPGGDYLDNLRRRISPTFLTNLKHLNSIDSGHLLPDGIADDGPNATVGQALSKWLHTPSKNGQPKEFRSYFAEINNWFDNHKQVDDNMDNIFFHNFSFYRQGFSRLKVPENWDLTFLRATTSVSYKIPIFYYKTTMPIEPFELVNERTNEKLTLTKERNRGDGIRVFLLMKRCPIIITETAAVQKDENSDDNLNNVKFTFWGGINCIGPLSPPAEEEKEEADE